MPATEARRWTQLWRTADWQWVVAGLAGVTLGGYVLVVSSLPAMWAILLVAVAVCPFGLMVTGHLRRVLLALIILDIPLQLDINIGYQQEAAALGALSGLNLSVTTGALAILYGWWLAGGLARVGAHPRPALQRSIPLAVYLIFVTLSVLVALDVQMAFFQLFLFWQSFMLFLYIVSTVRTRQEVDFILLILVIGLVLESVLMIGQQAIGRSISLGGGILSLQMVGSRVGGTLGHPNAAGSYLAMLLAPAVGILLTPTRGVQRWLAAAGLCLGTVALALTLSRGSWTAFAVSLMLVALFAWRRGWLSPTILPLSVIIGLLFFLAFQEPITARVLGDDAGSAQGRFPLMRLAFAMIEEHPILGVGANNYGLMIKQYATPEFGRDWLYVVHNHYLLVWAESGTVGFFAFVWFLLAILWRGWEGWRRNDRFLSPLALGLTAAVVGHLMHMNVDFFIHRPQVQLLWLFAGLITVIQTLAVQGEA